MQNRSIESSVATIERLGSIQNNAKEVSFLLWLNEMAICLDSPNTLQLSPYLSALQAIFYSHTDLDHCHRTDPEQAIQIPTYLQYIALPILRRMGIDIHSKYPNLQPLLANIPHVIPGIGEIVPRPLSHSDISLCGFQITTEDDKLIFVSPDNRSGNLTSKTLQNLQRWMSEHRRDEIDFLITDMTRVNTDPPLTFIEQAKRILQGKKLASQLRVPIVMRVKTGDFSQILVWLGEHLLPDQQTYMEPSLYKTFAELAELEPVWGRVLDAIQPLDESEDYPENTGTQLHKFDQLKVRNSEVPIYITDDPFDKMKVRKNVDHIFLYADSQINHINNVRRTAFSSQIHVSGHDEKSVYQYFTVLQPLHWTASHSGGSGYRNGRGGGNGYSRKTHRAIDMDEMVLRQKGQIFPIPSIHT